MSSQKTMNTKVVVQFIVLTFAIMLAAAAVEYTIAKTWGSMLVMEESGGFSFGNNAVFGIIAATLGALSPAFASFIVLKKNSEVKSLKQWLRNVFYFKTKVSHYIFVIIGVIAYFAVHIAFSGLTETMPINLLFVIIPLALIAGGMEEAGWSYILQPELTKKYGFMLSSIFTGLVWWAWHVPIFFIPGTSHYEVWNIWMYLFTLVGMRFFFGAILEISGKAGVCLSVLQHTLFNAFAMIYIFLPTNWTASLIDFALTIFLSVLMVYRHRKKQTQKEAGNFEKGGNNNNMVRG